MTYFGYGIRHSSEARRAKKLAETARNTFRDTWILDGIENGGFDKGEAPPPAEVQSHPDQSNEENELEPDLEAGREVVTLFKAGKFTKDAKAAGAAVMPGKGRRRSSVKPFPKLADLPEIRVVSATPNQSVFRPQHSVTSRAPVTVVFADVQQPEPQLTAEDLHQQIARSFSSLDDNNNRALSRERGLELAGKFRTKLESGVGNSLAHQPVAGSSGSGGANQTSSRGPPDDQFVRQVQSCK
jgi:hypothetical protein